MTLNMRNAAVVLAMVLIGASAADAEPAACLFKGGSYDGCAKQTLAGAKNPAAYDRLFGGGSYDGYAQGTLADTGIPPGPLRGTLIGIR